MRRLFLFLVTLLALSLPSALLAQSVGPLDVTAPLRTAEREYTLWVADTGSNTNDQIAGRGAVVMVGSMNPYVSVTQTSSITAPPWPCKLIAYVKDGNNSGTSACTGAWTVCGRDQFGGSNKAPSNREQCETSNANLAEGTPVKTTLVYESISSFHISGCSGGSNSADTVQLACSLDVGLPMPIRNSTGVVSVCMTDASGSLEPYCWTGSQVSEDVDLIRDSIQIYDNGVNAAGVGNSDTLNLQAGDGDKLKLRVRAN